MADETLRFDIVGDDRASGAFSAAGASAGEMSRHMDAAARSAAVLDEALKRQGAASRVSVDATLALARADKILEDAEHGLRDGALEAEFALKKQADAAKKAGDAADRAAAQNRGFAASLQKIADSAKKSGPGLLPGAALALTPAAGVLAGVAGGAAIGLGGAAIAGAGALAAFGAVAKPVLADALTAEQAVNTAQNNYNAAIAAGTKQAVAYKAEQIAIGKAYAELSPQQIALSVQLGNMANAWQNLKAAQTPVVAGALQPWLKSVTDLTSKLGPIIADVSPVIGQLGTQFDTLIRSPAFTAFRDFIANTGSNAVGAIGGTLIDFIKAFITILPQFDPLIEKAVGWIANLGPAVATWASSQKTADDITKFMVWFADNGPVVGSLLKNIGGALKALSPGLTAGGVTELKLISDFFGWVAKLPPSIAKPLADVAGTLLILNKLGVFSVGVKFVGLAAGWIAKLFGGTATAEIGGATAAAEMRAAFAAGGTAAAAEIRAAMTGGGAASGAEGAAGGAAGGAESGAGAGAAAGAGIGAALGIAVGGAIIGAAIRYLGEQLSPAGTFAGKLSAMFQGLSGPISSSVLHAFTFGGLEGKLTAEIGIPVGTVLNNILDGAKIWGGNISKSITGAWSNVAAGAKQWWGNITSSVTGSLASLLAGAKTWGGNITSSVAGTWNSIVAGAKTWVKNIVTTVAGAWSSLLAGAKTWGSGIIASIASTWNTVWTNTKNAVSAGVSAVVGFFTGLPGKIVSALGVAASVLTSWGSGVINGLLAGMKSVIGTVWAFIKSIPGQILSFLGIKSPPQWAIDAGVHIMNGIGIGMTQAQGALQTATHAVQSAAAAGQASTGGVTRWSGTVLQALKMLGLPAAYLSDVLYQMQTESGGNPTIVNTTDINWQEGHPSVGLMQVIAGTFAQYAGQFRNTGPFEYGVSVNPLANIYAALNYAAHGRGFGSGPGQIGSGHGYAFGTSSALAGWAMVGERGPEMVRFRGGEQVIPSQGGGSQDPLVAELRALRAELRQLTGVAAAIPARTGQHVGGAIAGAAGSASFRNRYPRGGS